MSAIKSRGSIGVAELSASTPAHYVHLHTSALTVANGSTLFRVVYPYASGARLVDLIIYQNSVGADGTSVSVDLRLADASSVLSALGVFTLASGANTVTDAKANIALPGGWTRPVLKTDTTVDISKGESVGVFTTETGVYTAHPTMYAVLVFEPKA
jgi:hypothetical protein